MFEAIPAGVVQDEAWRHVPGTYGAETTAGFSADGGNGAQRLGKLPDGFFDWGWKESPIPMAVAKTNLSKLAAWANETGRPVVVLRNGNPWFEIRPLARPHTVRTVTLEDGDPTAPACPEELHGGAEDGGSGETGDDDAEGDLGSGGNVAPGDACASAPSRTAAHRKYFPRAMPQIAVV